jgi:hypothetical protein
MRIQVLDPVLFNTNTSGSLLQQIADDGRRRKTAVGRACLPVDKRKGVKYNKKVGITLRWLSAAFFYKDCFNGKQGLHVRPEFSRLCFFR